MATEYVYINRFQVADGISELQADPIACEDPLLVSFEQGQYTEDFTLTMRTPGRDRELIYGLLFSEGVIQTAGQIEAIGPQRIDAAVQENMWLVKLAKNVIVDYAKISRRQASHAGCGLCGKTSLQALELKQSRAMRPLDVRLDNQLVRQLKSLLAKQPLFSTTGGVHVAGLVYEIEGELQPEASPCFEDVGRHNALDKLIGHELLVNDLRQPGILILSGRVGFELIQKAVMAGFSCIVALGAPTSMAVQAANQFGITLIGFAKAERFNLYTADQSTLKSS